MPLLLSHSDFKESLHLLPPNQKIGMGFGMLCGAPIAEEF